MKLQNSFLPACLKILTSELKNQPNSLKHSRQDNDLFIASQNVYFGALKDSSGFSDKDIQKIKKMISSCIYVKDIETLINPPEELKQTGRVFQVDYNHKGIQFYNFRLSDFDKRDQNKGVCDDLAEKYKAILEKEFAGKYVFKVVNGANNKYFPLMNHYFILAWFNTDSVNKTIQQQLNNNQSRFPNNCLIIDPSLKIVGLSTRDFIKKNGYKISYLVSSNKLSQQTIDRFSHITKNPNYTETLGCSLGYIQHLDFEKSLSCGKNSIVILKFRHYWDNNIPTVMYSLINSDGIIKDWENWRSEVAPDSILMKLAQKIESDFTKQV